MIFNDIKHIDKFGNEYWLARELQEVLEYKKWDKFCNVIDIAKKACNNSNYNALDHFLQVGKMIRTAINSGVKDLAKFHNAGYKGLYNGETADDIFKRKNLRYREDILDNMGSTELANNLFRIAQTNDKLKRDKVDNEYTANSVHYEMGEKVRKAIQDMGGVMPEELLTPSKSLKDVNKNKSLT